MFNYFDEHLSASAYPSIEIDSQLMQNFRLASLAQMDSEMFAVATPEGPWLLSMGEDQAIYLSRPSSEKREAWTYEKVVQTDLKAPVFWAGAYKNGVLVIYPEYMDQGKGFQLVAQFRQSHTRAWEKFNFYQVADVGYKLVRVFAREMKGELYVGYLHSLTEEAEDTAPPYLLKYLRVAGFAKGDKIDAGHLRVNVDSTQHEFGLDQQMNPGLFSLCTEQIFTRPAKTYTGVYRTDGNKKDGDYKMTVFRPNPPKGFRSIGHLAVPGHVDAHTGEVETLAFSGLPIGSSQPFIFPNRLELQYYDKGSSGKNPFAEEGHDGQLFRPSHEKTDYVALGDIGAGLKNDKAKNDTSLLSGPEGAYVLVHKDWVVAAELYAQRSDCTEQKEACNANLVWKTKEKVKEQEAVAVDYLTIPEQGRSLGKIFRTYPYKKESPGTATGYTLADKSGKSGLYFIDLQGSLSSPRIEQISPLGEVNGLSIAYHPDRPSAVGVEVDGSMGIYLFDLGSHERTPPMIFLPEGKSLNNHELMFKADGRLEAYLWGEDFRLYHSQVSQETKFWTSPMALGSGEVLQVLGYATAQGLKGVNSCFAFGAQHRLRNIQYDDHADHITYTTINFGNTDHLQSYFSYNLEAFFRDTLDTPMEDLEVEISADSHFAATANATPILLGKEPYTLKTTTGGKLVLSIEVYDITAPPIYLRVPQYMTADEEEHILVQPSAGVAEQLRGLDVEGLKGATKNAHSSQPEPLLAEGAYDDETLASVAEGINSLLDLTPTIPEANEKYLRQPALKARRVASFRKGKHLPAGNLLQGERLKEQHWTLSFKGGGARFRRLSREEGRAAIAQVAQMEYPAMRKSAEKDWWHVDWGHVWHSIKHGFEELEEMTVSVVKGVVEIAIETANYAWNGFVSLVEHVFDAIQGVFNKIGAFFKDLVQWLGYLFAWEDIRRTQIAVVHTVRETMKFSPMVIGAIEESVDSILENLATAVQDNMALLKNSLNTSMARENQQANSSNRMDGSDRHNVALNGLQANTGQIESEAVAPANTDVSIPEPDTETDAYQKAMQAFNSARDELLEIIEEPNDILRLLMDALLDIAEGLVELLIALLESLINELLEMVSVAMEEALKMLEAKVHIPLVSQLFHKMLEGDAPEIDSDYDFTQLNMLNILGLVVAVGLSPSYKALTGEILFPITEQEDTLVTYCNHFSFDNLRDTYAGDVAARRRLEKAVRVTMSPRKAYKDELEYDSPNFFHLGSILAKGVALPINALLDPEMITGVVTKVTTEVSKLKVYTDLFQHVFDLPLYPLLKFGYKEIVGESSDHPFRDSDFRKVIGWGLGFLPMGQDAVSIIKKGTVAELADTSSVIMNCVLHVGKMGYEIYRIVKDGVEDAVTETAFFLGELAGCCVVLKAKCIPEQYQPLTNGAYTILHALSFFVQSVSEAEAFYVRHYGLDD